MVLWICWKVLILELYLSAFFLSFRSLFSSLSVGIQVHYVSCFELCFQYRRHTCCREIHAACFLNLHTKDRPKFSRDHSIGQPNMIQRDKNIKGGGTLGRLLAFLFHHHTQDIPALSENAVVTWNSIFIDHLIYVIYILCYGAALDLLVSSHVGIPLQIIDCAAPPAASTVHENEVWEWIRACAVKPSPVVSHLFSSGTAWQFGCPLSYWPKGTLRCLNSTLCLVCKTTAVWTGDHGRPPRINIWLGFAFLSVIKMYFFNGLRVINSNMS